MPGGKKKREKQERSKARRQADEQALEQQARDVLLFLRDDLPLNAKRDRMEVLHFDFEESILRSPVFNCRSEPSKPCNA